MAFALVSGCTNLADRGLAARVDDWTLSEERLAELWRRMVPGARARRFCDTAPLLERAFARGWGNLRHTAADPDLKSLRSHPRFKQLLRGDRAD